MKRQRGFQEDRRGSQRAGQLALDPVTLGSRVYLRKGSQCPFSKQGLRGVSGWSQTRVWDKGLQPNCHRVILTREFQDDPFDSSVWDANPFSRERVPCVEAKFRKQHCLSLRAQPVRFAIPGANLGSKASEPWDLGQVI